ncbi:MAG: GPW/gp25 family protein [Pseudobutyrivibrio sp.]|uniref:GPW/gp25 family protein n=1 Tax=Pseudobutyrivibrio sp. TaxID=2014367 RepID=UPI001B054E56|nr:GPW/gp25 family protein [Pseudobutyrivibrio sp.]MBO6283445.1 GPW/gp25 family protein [Pseudobutyrivibrio sp.]MBP3261190.1 GPW/gp25 family protein [Pseudobutyrivibrio sp.]
MDMFSNLGQSMKFPPQVDPATGRFVVSSGRDSVRESLYLILMTTVGERFMNPDFGTKMMNYTFMDTSLTMLNIFTSELRNTILEQETRIADVDINVDAQSKEGALIINLNYYLVGSDFMDNFVFPFYLNNDSNEEEVTEEY